MTFIPTCVVTQSRYSSIRAGTQIMIFQLPCSRYAYPAFPLGWSPHLAQVGPHSPELFLTSHPLTPGESVGACEIGFGVLSRRCTVFHTDQNGSDFAAMTELVGSWLHFAPRQPKRKRAETVCVYCHSKKIKCDLEVCHYLSIRGRMLAENVPS